MKKRPMNDRTRQGALFQGIEDGPGPARRLMIPLDFRGRPIRMFWRADDPRWIFADVCASLDQEVSDVSRRLEEDEKELVDIREFDAFKASNPLGGNPHMLAVNLKGLSRTLARSDSPLAKPFQNWLFGEVVPQIFKTGSYVLPTHKRVVKEQRRLRCDADTAIARCKQFEENRQSNSRLYSEGVNAAAWHDSGYLGAFGLRARELRAMVGLSAGRTPLDRMSSELLAQNFHAKQIANRVARERSISPHKQPFLFQVIARKQMKADLALLPAGATFGVVDGGPRGKILDFVCPQDGIDPQGDVRSIGG